MRRSRRVALSRPDDLVKRTDAQLAVAKLHRRQNRVGNRLVELIVEADHGHVVGHTEPFVT